mmetsp:Transcript_17086/g.59942  ORF Transcript_17086/g.59942 Transcript_17086/m.59942 type:complete len:257 (+) Transcript_17086:414-1184(+)
MPLRVSSSIRFTSYGSRTCRSLYSFTVTGNVAENNRIWRSRAVMRVRSSSTGMKSGDSSLSASSSTSIDTRLSFAMPRDARSRMRPGVPTSTCTVSYRRMMSSRRLVPPVLTMHLTSMCLASSRTTADVCSASSRVGASTSTMGPLALLLSGFCAATCTRAGSMNAIVLPLPVAAMPTTSRPLISAGQHCAWIGVGFSKPLQHAIWSCVKLAPTCSKRVIGLYSRPRESSVKATLTLSRYLATSASLMPVTRASGT